MEAQKTVHCLNTSQFMLRKVRRRKIKMVKERNGKDRRANPDRRKGGDSGHTDSERRETGNRRLDIERRKNDE